VGLPDSVRRNAPELWWDSAKPLYDAGKYAEAAEVGRRLVADRPDQPYLFYNLACCESLTGQKEEALDHLRRALELSDMFRDYAKGDSDLDAMRDEPGFAELVGAQEVSGSTR
jgi:tetratricopeptide (TPR) repeat protein